MYYKMLMKVQNFFMLYFHYIFVFSFIFFIDFATKIVAKVYIAEHESVEIIQHFFSFTLAFNRGVAFSLPIPYILQIFASLIMIAGIAWWVKNYFEEISALEKYGITLLLAGASANLWERIIAQHVTDFLHFYIAGYSFPIFNIADIAIFFGVVMWFFGTKKS